MGLDPEPDGAPGAARLEARNLVWMGTTVASGTGKAVVMETGPGTEFGRVYQLTANATTDSSPLRRQVGVMARRVAAAALGVSLFTVHVLAGGSLVETFVFALGVMVALVPEGLPATMSVALAIPVRRMARRHALIKKLRQRKLGVALPGVQAEKEEMAQHAFHPRTGATENLGPESFVARAKSKTPMPRPTARGQGA